MSKVRQDLLQEQREKQGPEAILDVSDNPEAVDALAAYSLTLKDKTSPDEGSNPPQKRPVTMEDLKAAGLPQTKMVHAMAVMADSLDEVKELLKK